MDKIINKTYKTRIVVISEDKYYVEYRWGGNWWRGFLTDKTIWWTRWSMCPDSTLEKARETAKQALKSHELNYSWNTRVVE